MPYEECRKEIEMLKIRPTFRQPDDRQIAAAAPTREAETREPRTTVMPQYDAQADEAVKETATTMQIEGSIVETGATQDTTQPQAEQTIEKQTLATQTTETQTETTVGINATNSEQTNIAALEETSEEGTSEETWGQTAKLAQEEANGIRSCVPDATDAMDAMQPGVEENENSLNMALMEKNFSSQEVEVICRGGISIQAQRKTRQASADSGKVEQGDKEGRIEKCWRVERGA